MRVFNLSGAVAALTTALLLCCGTVQADEVRLSDGSTLKGNITQVADGSVTIYTQHLGPVTIGAESIVGIATDTPRTIKLADGRTETGRLLITEAGMQLRMSDDGVRPISSAEIVSILPVLGATVPAAPAQTVLAKPEYKPSPKVMAAQQQEEDDAATERAERTTPVWSTRLEIGLNGKSGNTDTLDFRGRIEAKRETEDTRLKLYVFGTYSEENSIRSDNEVIGGARYEKDINKDWFWYLRGELEIDEFESIDLRSTAVVGLGYHAIVKDNQHWDLRGGVGYRREEFDTGRTEDDIILDLGWDYHIDLGSNWKFTNTVSWTPTFADPMNDYLLVVDTGIEVPITNDEVWKARAGLRNEYNSMPNPGNDHLDNTYYFSLIRDW